MLRSYGHSSAPVLGSREIRLYAGAFRYWLKRPPTKSVDPDKNTLLTFTFTLTLVPKPLALSAAGEAINEVSTSPVVKSIFTSELATELFPLYLVNVPPM